MYGYSMTLFLGHDGFRFMDENELLWLKEQLRIHLGVHIDANGSVGYIVEVRRVETNYKGCLVIFVHGGWELRTDGPLRARARVRACAWLTV